MPPLWGSAEYSSTFKHIYLVLETLPTTGRTVYGDIFVLVFLSAREPCSCVLLLPGSSPILPFAARSLRHHAQPSVARATVAYVEQLQKCYSSWSMARNSNLWSSTTRFLVVSQHPCSLFHSRALPCPGSRQANFHSRKQAIPTRPRQQKPVAR